jgi:CPA2 family monovalent cation:H+ antiporter-2
VVGQLEAENVRDKPVRLRDAVGLGGILPAMEALTRDQAIFELVAAVPLNRLPAGTDAAQLAALVLAREEEISTDLGNGIAIPHARCPGLAAPVVVIGRSKEGVLYTSGGEERVRLFFLLVSPAERPETQLSLLRQLAKLAGTEDARRELMASDSPADLLEILHRRLEEKPASPASDR